MLEWLSQCGFEQSRSSIEEDEALCARAREAGSLRLAAAIGYRLERKKLYRAADRMMRVLLSALSP